MFKIIVVTLLGAWIAQALQTVAYVDLNKYAGRWYQQARNQRIFEPWGCACAQQTLTLNPKGYVDVYNSCNWFSAKGRLAEIRGQAYNAETKSNAHLVVDFGLPYMGQYWIIALEPSYEWAVVSEPKEKSLYILSKSPVLPEFQYRAAVRAAATQVDTDKLKLTSHENCTYPPM